jgi:predicted N-acyltransferase
MDQPQIEIQVLSSLSQIDAEDWDACACPEAAEGGAPLDPFTTHRFLRALELSGSVGQGTGWQPQYLTAYMDGMLVACAPLYAKYHSQGEYIFDHSWAHAYERAGGQYYPKLQIAVPFTPATGRRFLVRPGYDGIGQSALVQGMVQLAADNRISSAHVTFCIEEEARMGREMGLMERSSQQFHWLNRGYADFDGFLSDLSSRKRKTIRKERKQAQAFGGTIQVFSGDQLRPDHWEAFWDFYQDTGARKWGSPYLTRAFFDLVHRDMAQDVVLVLAEREGRWIAGALNFIGRETLFGRYWGCTEHHPFLHFELCYYQAIDLAIARGLGRVEAGAQGEHKLARGYLPTQTYSLHWFGDPGFAQAVKKYLEAEREAVSEEIEILTDYGPFRKDRVEEQE